MLNEFILERLDAISQQKKELSEKLREVSAEENKENSRITGLLNVDDVGKELFSPRGSQEPLKLQIGQIRKHVEELLLQEAKLQDDLELLTVEEEKYRQMLAEAKAGVMSDEQPGGQDEQGGIETIVKQQTINRRNSEEMEILLKRLEQCIQYSMTDQEKCTTELTNLKYYVMALISDVSRET